MYPDSFEAACFITGENAANEKFLTGTPDEIAFKRLKVVTDAINRIDNSNQPWQPDFNNYKERKWRQWWDLEKTTGSSSGFRFISSLYATTDTITPVGLCYKTQGGSDFSANTFLNDWKAYITGA